MSELLIEVKAYIKGSKNIFSEERVLTDIEDLRGLDVEVDILKIGLKKYVLQEKGKHGQIAQSEEHQN